MAQEQIQQPRQQPIARPEMSDTLKAKLIHAIQTYDIPMLEDTLAKTKGMNLNFQYKGGTPLIWVCLSKYPTTTMAEMLLNNGSNPNIKSQDLRTSPLNTLCIGMDSIDSIETATLLIGRGAIIDCSDTEGNTALHYACSAGRIDMVKLLLDKGADINDPFNSGHTALANAAFGNHSNVIKLFVQLNPNINVDALGIPERMKVMVQEGIDAYKGIGRFTKAAPRESVVKEVEQDDDATTTVDLELVKFHKAWQDADDANEALKATEATSTPREETPVAVAEIAQPTEAPASTATPVMPLLDLEIDFSDFDFGS